MPGGEDLGKMLVAFGLVLAGAGLLLWLGGQVLNLGRLPGDILIRKGNFAFYLPLVTSIVLSVILTLIINLIARR